MRLGLSGFVPCIIIIIIIIQNLNNPSHGDRNKKIINTIVSPARG
jgi:hypothetical protein